MDKLKEALSLTGKIRHTDFYAISDLSFRVKSGEILGIMGKNGSGKSTLLKMITGIYEPTEGNITVHGKISSLLELGTGFNIEYTGMENIFFYGTLMGFTQKEMEEKLQSIIEFAEIGDYIYQPVKTYSSGMFARLAFSCAINVEPDILIVDEILSVGDIRFQAKCFNKFKEFREKGVTILYVGHDVGMMRSFCDRAMWINNGALVDIGDPGEVSAKYVEFMYLDEKDTFTTYKKFTLDPEEEICEETILESPSAVVETHEENTERLFPHALAHWGTHKGLITEAYIRNVAGGIIEHFMPEDTVILGFEFDAKDINFDVLSVAISIKNKEGTDIIVKTSFDENVKIVGQNGRRYRVEFKLKTYLAVGEYYLVVALENRTEITPMYYEYIDGALYFKVYTDKKIYGQLDIPSEINMYEV